MSESLFSKSTFTYKKKIVFNAGAESSFEYANPQKNTSPSIQLLLSPFGLPFVPIEIVGTNINKIISSLEWTKDRNNPAGVLALTIVPDKYLLQQITKIFDKYSKNLYSKIWKELGEDLENIFKPMAMCQLWINGYHIMTGNVRSCRRASSVSNNSKETAYTVLIDELGNVYNNKILSQDTLSFDLIQTNAIDALDKAGLLVANLQGVPLNIGILSILNAFKLTTLQQGMTLSDGLPLAARLLSLPPPLGAVSSSSIASFLSTKGDMFRMHSHGGGQQSFWEYLKSFVPSPWMEFYSESGGRTIATGNLQLPTAMMPGFNYIVARSVPYSNPLLGVPHPLRIADTMRFDLNALQMLAYGDFIIITDEMVQQKDLGTDSSAQSTVFYTTYTSGGVTAAPDLVDSGIKSVGPMNPFASGGIGTFGIQEMFQTIDCTNIEGLGTAASAGKRIGQNIVSGPGQIAKGSLNNLLALWFRNQSRFREGSVTVKGMPWARPGMYCLYLPTWGRGEYENLRDIGIYYIDSLNHNYELSNTDVNFTTTLNLIRGVPLPSKIASTALLLFDFEVLPPQAGLTDGEYTLLRTIRQALTVGGL